MKAKTLTRVSFYQKSLLSRQAMLPLACILCALCLVSCQDSNLSLTEEPLPAPTLKRSATAREAVLSTPQINPFDRASCTAALGDEGSGGTVTGSGTPGNQFGLFDLEGNLVKPRWLYFYDPEAPVYINGTFEFHNVPNGNYQVIAFNTVADLASFAQGSV